MAIDASLVVQVNSVGIKESTDLLKSFVGVAGEAEAATVSLATANSSGAKSTTDTATAIDKLLNKFRQQVDLLGANVSEKNTYIAITKKATQAQADEAGVLGTQVDAFKQLTSQQRLGASTAKAVESQIRSNIQAEKDYISALQLKVAMQDKDRGSQEALRAQSKGLSAEAVDQARALGGQLKETGDHAEKFALKTAFATVGAKREVMVLAHEVMQGNFSKIPGSFMVLGERVGATGAIFSVTFGLILTGVIAVAALAYGLIQASKDVEKFNNSLILTGNAAGMTRSNLEDMAKGFATNKVSVGAARDMLEALVTTGEYSGKTIQEIGKSAIIMAQLTGQSTTEVLSFYDGLGDGAAKWALKHNKSMGTMTGAQYEYIKKLEETGHAQEAMAAAVAAMTPKLDTQTQRVGYATMIWQGWVLAIRAVADLVHNFGAGNTLQEDANKAAEVYGNLAEKYFEGKKAGRSDTQLKQLHDKLLAAQNLMNDASNKVKSADDKAAKDELDTETRKQGVLATERRMGREREFETKAQYRTRERQAIVLDAARELADAAQAGKLSTEKRMEILSTRDRIIRQMEESNPDKKNAGAAAAAKDAYGAQVKTILAEVEQAKRDLADTKELDNTLFKTGQIGRLEQIKRDGDAAIAMYEDESKAYDKLIKIAGKKTNGQTDIQEYTKRKAGADDNGLGAATTAARDSAIEIARLDKENTDRHVKELERRGRYDEAAAIKNEQLFRSKITQEENQLQFLEDQMSGDNAPKDIIGMLTLLKRIDTAKEHLRGLKAEAEDNVSKGAFDTAKAKFDTMFQGLQDKIAAIKAHALDGGGLFAGLGTDAKVQGAIKGLAPELKAAADEFNRVAANGQNAGAQMKLAAKAQNDLNKELGLTAANDPYMAMQLSIQKYGDSAQQVGTDIGNTMDKAFKGAEDAFVTFATTGKLSFKGLANSIISDLARIEAKRLIASLTGSGASGGGGSILGTLFSAGMALFGGPAATAAQSGVGSLGGFGGGVETASMIAGHAYGGTNLPNTIGEVNEKGPEMLTTGGRDYLMTGSKSGTITPADKLGGGINITSAPTINIDARSDQAQVRALVNQAIQQGNASLVDKLNRQRKI